MTMQVVQMILDEVWGYGRMSYHVPQEGIGPDAHGTLCDWILTIGRRRLTRKLPLSYKRPVDQQVYQAALALRPDDISNLRVSMKLSPTPDDLLEVAAVDWSQLLGHRVILHYQLPSPSELLARPQPIDEAGIAWRRATIRARRAMLRQSRTTAEAMDGYQWLPGLEPEPEVAAIHDQLDTLEQMIDALRATLPPRPATP